MIAAIETRYNGYRFRSRTEARWAVYFDACGIKYEYEPQGLSLPSGSYLPDFWLPQVSMYAEVKGATFTPREISLCIELVATTKRGVVLLDGLPENHAYLALLRADFLGEERACEIYADFVQVDGSYLDEHRFFKNGEMLLCVGHDDEPEQRAIYNDWFQREVLRRDTFTGPSKAVAASRSARFEHGENGNG